ncbi:hypothetical protein OG946_18720 [Streptomyces sp. NBC_01808]|uniref:hypothetical protein n=1 Tax=Streptomyces sp. NBC_01808 TaxID=2975947 RepID=UPI002DD83B29|nr:hypothetical protein [Streptomyces sp. NBC_01808]WSA39215.1 hypothetical protein OG946_18720 [Streptomyces sp. NBC_01808]
MTRPRRVPDAATRRLRLLGYVLVLLGLFAGAASCADAGRSDTAASHGLVLRAAAPQVDVLDVLRPDVPPDADLRPDAAPADGLPADASPADGLRADASPTAVSPADSLRADGLPGDASPVDGLPTAASPADPLPAGPPGEVVPFDRSAAGAPLPEDCTAAHTPGGSAGDCPAASKRAAAPPLSGAGAWPPPGDGPPCAPSAAAIAECGVSPAPPGALGTPDLHRLQVQRT